MDKKLVEFIFTYPKSFKIAAWIIKMRLGTSYSHVAIKVRDSETSLNEIYQASHGMVHSIEEENFRNENHILKSFELYGDRESMIRLLTFLKKQEGKSYSELGAIACTIKPLRMIGIGQDGDREFICSEYGARALEEFVGKKLNFFSLKTDYVDPEDFELFLEKLKIQ